MLVSPEKCERALGMLIRRSVSNLFSNSYAHKLFEEQLAASGCW